MSQSGERVFDGNRLRLTHFNGGNSRAILTFDFLRKDREGFGEISPSNSLRRWGWDQISLRSARNDWFINGETEAMEDALVTACARFETVAAIGFSMGGYGALRFAKSVGASRVIAISPQVSIHPRVVPWDKRYHKNAVEFEPRLGALGSRANGNLEGMIVFDPFEPFDRRHARRISDLYPCLRPVALPFGGHPASGVLRAAGRAGLLMEMLARDGGPGLHDLRNTYRTIRRGEPTYLISLARHALHRHTRVADWALSRLEEMDTDGGSNPLDAGQESS